MAIDNSSYIDVFYGAYTYRQWF